MTVGRGVIWKKNKVEDAWCFDMTYLAKRVDLGFAGSTVVTWTSRFSGTASIGIDVLSSERLLFHYAVTNRSGDQTTYSYFVDLESTPCYFGSKRWWFTCPECDRRCRILYLVGGSRYFVCRICRNLTYRSQQEKKSIFVAVLEAIMGYEKLLWQYHRARSPRKQARLVRKLWRTNALLEAFVSKHGRGERRKR